VTSANRRIERLADVAAAITVITGEDLRRMGVTNLAQALRLAGHLHVSQISGPQYGIAARGFAISTANKMLVLIDGRTVYSPVFAGVFWETQDVVIPDVDRIEVTRGPGGAVWGANAVNGVDQRDHEARDGNEGHARQCVRRVRACSGLTWCGMAGASGAPVRIGAYVKVRFEDSHQLLSGADAFDDFDFGQAGFRAESDPSRRSQIVVQGDMYTGTTGLSSTAEANCRAATCWGGGRFAGASHATNIQVYFDHTYRRVPGQYRGSPQHDRCRRAASLERRAATTSSFGTGYRRYDGDDLGDGPGLSSSSRASAPPTASTSLGRTRSGSRAACS
jgi:iron complex outermembrane receptor protein